MGWIYAFRDSRYELGVKIGWDGSRKGNERIKKAQSYTPGRIIYEAAWEIPSELRIQLGSYNDVENKAQAGLTPLIYPNNGTEWFDVDIKETVQRVSDNLKVESCKVEWASTKNYDEFRCPRDTEKERIDRFKQVLWLYEENLTKRLKLQRIDDWTTPLEGVRTYSRNGFKPILALTYDGAPSRNQNYQVVQFWENTMRDFHSPVDNSTYGWLPDGINVESLIEYLKRSVLVTIEAPFSSRPLGVRKSYNKAE